jgi:FMN phosphatase YigB (HAD superfamily)
VQRTSTEQTSTEQTITGMPSTGLPNTAWTSAEQTSAGRRTRAVEAVVFDVGETLVNETAEWGLWADWLEVPRHTFSAVFGAVIASGRDHREVFDYFKPGFDLETERRRRAAAGMPDGFSALDLYPDARPALAALRAAGYLVVLAGNQPARAQRVLHALDLPVDHVATSAQWGVAKPHPDFFLRVVRTCAELRPGGLRADQICYVGDRLDNDLRPAWQVGMRTAFIRRGPWGYVHATHPDLARADFTLRQLTELPALIARDGDRIRARDGDRIRVGVGVPDGALDALDAIG